MKPVVDALCSLKDINALAASTILVTTGDLSRFGSAAQLMSYFRLVPSEHSSGPSVDAAASPRPATTKSGACFQAAWSYRGRRVIAAHRR